MKVAFEEGQAVVDFMEETSEGVTSCMAKFNCWRGMSAYPKDIFSEKLGFFVLFVLCAYTPNM